MSSPHFLFLMLAPPSLPKHEDRFGAQTHTHTWCVFLFVCFVVVFCFFVFNYESLNADRRETQSRVPEILVIILVPISIFFKHISYFLRDKHKLFLFFTESTSSFCSYFSSFSLLGGLTFIVSFQVKDIFQTKYHDLPETLVNAVFSVYLFKLQVCVFLKYIFRDIYKIVDSGDL